MMTIYLDADFCCYSKENEKTVQSIETDFFNGKCNTFIEGYRFVPYGQTWVRNDGEIFNGEMVAPHKDFSILDYAQKLYEETQASAIKEERIVALEEENVAKDERIVALEEENAMLMECLLEMSEIVYA